MEVIMRLGSYTQEDNKYYFITDGNFYCDYTNETNINITTKYNVTYNNIYYRNDNKNNLLDIFQANNYSVLIIVWILNISMKYNCEKKTI